MKREEAAWRAPCWASMYMRSAAVLFPLVGLAAEAAAGCISGGGATNVPADASGTMDAPADASVAMDASASLDSALEAYTGPCTFSPDAYDLSCATDTDCVAVAAGYYCSPAQCGCIPIGIGKSALAQFNADVAKTPLGSGKVEGADCGCTEELGPCCLNGACQAGAGCYAGASDTLPACADAGGTCARSPDNQCSSAGEGPPDSCAYPDEKCCL
jgi:hypothetical protein